MMNQRKILLQLLPGFIPLFAFILADEIWGTTVGLWVAIALGFGELAYYWIKDRRFDAFILFDTLLIVALGGVSIVLDNDIFFKLKPALVGVLMCGVLGVSAFSSGNILLNMSKRYMKGIELNDQQYRKMRQSMQGLFWVFTAYTVLVFYSALFMSKEAWAFISGGLFYVVAGGYFMFEFIRSRVSINKLKNEEWLLLLNENGEIVGKAPRSVCHSSKEYLHPVVHLHVVNKQGELFLQKRPMNKRIQPGKWDTAVGGHIAFGEDVTLALQREAFEEIGIKDFTPQIVGTYIWESSVEREYVFCFITQYDGGITTHKEELDGGRFWTFTEISRNLGKGVFTQNFEEEFKSKLQWGLGN